MAQDDEIDQIKQSVSCAVLLERAGFKVDEQESSRNAIKYRRGRGETVIVNHDGRGWWDTQSSARGDVFTLAQHLDPNLNFGQVRVQLRGLAGIAPSFPAALRTEPDERPPESPIRTWSRRSAPREGSPAWRYLTEARALPPEIVVRAIAQDSIREGPNGTAWFAHRSELDSVVGIEGRGPEYHGFSKGGQKTLFRFAAGDEPPTRIAVNESAIETLSLATLEGHRPDTLYVGTGGGMGPHTIDALKTELADLVTRPGARMAIATNNDEAGDRYAARLADIAREAGVPASRRRPAGAINDWNQMVQINAGIAPNPNISQPEAAPQPAPNAASSTQEKPAMSDTYTPRSDPAAQAPISSRTNTAGPQGGAPDNAARPQHSAPAGTWAAGKKDPIVELLEELRKAAEHMPEAQREAYLKQISGLLAMSAQPGNLANDLFRTRVAWVTLDLERVTGRTVTMPSALASEMSDRAVAAPGLTHPDMVQLMRATPRVSDQKLINEIRGHAIELGRQPYPQSSPDIDRNIERLRARVIDAGNWLGDRVQTGATIDGKQDRAASGADVDAAHAAAKTTIAGRREQRVEAARTGGDNAPPPAVAVRVPTTGLVEGIARVAEAFRRPRSEQAAATSAATAAPAQSPQRPDARSISDAIRQEAAGNFGSTEPLDVSKHFRPVDDYVTGLRNGMQGAEAAPSASSQEGRSFAGAQPHSTVERMLNAAGLGATGSDGEAAGKVVDWKDNPTMRTKIEGLANRNFGPHIAEAETLARGATAAMQELLEGPGAEFRRKIAATAAAENSTSAAIVAEMRPDGRHAALRTEFDQALQNNPVLAQTLDNATSSLRAYTDKRVRLEGGYDAWELDKGDLFKRFGGIDSTLSQAASTFPAREAGKSLIDTVGERLAELFERVVNAVKQAFGVQAGNAASQGPSPHAA
jgi:Protein of unknown function (DUF3991)/Toprim-like